MKTIRRFCWLALLVLGKQSTNLLNATQADKTLIVQFKDDNEISKERALRAFTKSEDDSTYKVSIRNYRQHLMQTL